MKKKNIILLALAVIFILPVLSQPQTTVLRSYFLNGQDFIAMAAREITANNFENTLEWVSIPNRVLEDVADVYIFTPRSSGSGVYDAEFHLLAGSSSPTELKGTARKVIDYTNRTTRWDIEYRAGGRTNQIIIVYNGTW